MTVQLPAAVDISAFLIDPSGTCGDDATATTREFRVETSTDGTTFRTAVDGRGALAFTPAAIGELNERVPTGDTGRAVREVRITLLSPLRQPTPGDSGRDFIDLTEFEVIGNALPDATLAVSNASPKVGEAITFDAGGSTDQDSAISGYDWDFDGNGSVDRTTTGGDDQLRVRGGRHVRRAGLGQGRPRRRGHGDPDRHGLGGRRRPAAPAAAPAAAAPPPPRPRLSVPGDRHRRGDPPARDAAPSAARCGRRSP